MPAAIVGYTDSLGYLRCAPCALEAGRAELPVWSDTGPHAAEPCDRCGQALRAVVSPPRWGVFCQVPETWGGSRYFASVFTAAELAAPGAPELMRECDSWPAALRVAERLNLAERIGGGAGVMP